MPQGKQALSNLSTDVFENPSELLKTISHSSEATTNDSTQDGLK